jgi:hypothetical protein
MPALMSHDVFMTTYYEYACKIADITIASIVKKNGAINPAIDVESIKASGAISGLERTYINFDPQHKSGADVKPFLSTVVRNCVISELEKATTAAIHAGLMKPRASKRQMTKEEEEQDLERTCRIIACTSQRSNIIGPIEGHVYQETEGWQERKEEILNRLAKFMLRLPVYDQVILSLWAEDEKTYVEKSLEELGIEHTPATANWVYGRKNKALKALAKMMGGKKPDYRDIYLPSAGRNTNSAMYTDRNELRRHQYAAKAQVTRNINYKKTALLLDKKFFKYS